MAFISREQFLKQQEQNKERAAAYAAAQNGPRVGFFSLKNDGDEAVVRFCYTSPDEFDILTTHSITENGKFRRVNCLRGIGESLDSCPLCASGNKMQQRFYIKLVEYTRDENDNVVATPKIWERPTTYVQRLSQLFAEYGNISDSVFKVKRIGEAGSMQTDYTIMYPNPTIYNNDVYKKAENPFEGYSIIGHAVLDKKFDELASITGVTPTEKPAEQTNVVNASEHSSAPRKVTY